MDSKQPGILYILIVIEFFMCCAFWGFYPLFDNYLVSTLHLEPYLANKIWADFAGLVFCLVLIGGWLGGRYISHRTSCLIALLILFLGFSCVVIIPASLKIGLALIACGRGILTPNILNLLGTHKTSNRWQHYTGFGILQGANLVAQILGPILCYRVSLFATSGLFWIPMGCSLISIFIYLLFFSYIKKNSREHIVVENKHALISMCVIMLMLVSAILVMLYDNLAIFVSVIGIWIGYKIYSIYTHADNNDKKNIISIISVMFSFFVFAICSKQEVSTMTSFIQNIVDHRIISIQLTLGDFMAIDPITGAILTIIFILLARWALKHNKSFNLHVFLRIGLLAILFAYVTLYLITLDNTKIAVVAYLPYIIFMGTAGFIMIPLAAAAINELAPQEWRGFFMGALIYLLGFSAVINKSIMDSLISKTANIAISEYHHLFSYLGIFVLVCIIILNIFWYFHKLEKAVSHN